jgi:hypothetical protein
MSENLRHHRAHAGETRIVLVPVPVPAAGVDFGKQRKPPAYPVNQRQPWPPRVSKAQTLRNFLDSINRNDAAAREFMRHAREASRHVRG